MILIVMLIVIISPAKGELGSGYNDDDFDCGDVDGDDFDCGDDGDDDDFDCGDMLIVIISPAKVKPGPDYHHLRISDRIMSFLCPT